MEIFAVETSEPSGPAVYDEASGLERKKASVLKGWRSMISKVESALKKGDKKAAKAVFDTNLTSLKIDMRRIAKVACGGDVVLRVREDSEIPVFDYNSGTFGLKPPAAKAEAVFSKINELYFPQKNEPDAEAMLSSVSEIEALFQDWLDSL
eukprot:CAMPEP_0194586112 /NCGR_PEP_ID=MMETSP0292-20121207/18213_1 /TAXON_ID=39354 /ORGANISM="Heterosigma akashiwo, Strain CCMP2393" /LENGTH=150 /DNA_ID=CAMNT_0039441807 /DNA_START=305 /DNA_END=757 /DNA_ORIENTATION=+